MVYYTRAQSHFAIAVTSESLEREEIISIEAMRSNRDGKPGPINGFPKWVRAQEPLPKTLPSLFNAGGLWSCTEEFAKVMLNLPLGRSRLHPYSLYDYDGTPSKGNPICYALDVSENLETVDPELSSPGAVRQSRFDAKVLNLLLDEDDTVYAKPMGDNSFGMWKDPRIPLVLFLDNAVFRETSQDNLPNGYPAIRCREKS